jgi:hypothetical protein
MTITKAQYEEFLAECSSSQGAIALLKGYRSYLEMLPSMRRPLESVITIPLPVVRFRNGAAEKHRGPVSDHTAVCLPCDLAFLMCDPEWKIKTGVEIFVFIHQPQEDFSDLLSRWRETQVNLSRGYEWDMPLRYRHILSEGADTIYPLFVLFDETPERIKRGLKGAFLPYVLRSVQLDDAKENGIESPELASDDSLWAGGQEDILHPES